MAPISKRFNSGFGKRGLLRDRLTEARTRYKSDEHKVAWVLSGGGVLMVHASSSRSQSANRQEARERLAELVRGALVVQRKRRPTRPTRASRERRLSQKKRTGQQKRGRQRFRED